MNVLMEVRLKLMDVKKDHNIPPLTVDQRGSDPRYES